MELSKKAQRIQASVTLAITAKAKEMKEDGIVDILKFGIAFSGKKVRVKTK